MLPYAEAERAPREAARARRARRASRGASLRVNFTWTFAGNAIYAACHWSLFVVLARLAGQEALGRYALAAAVCTPIFLLTGMQLRAAQASDAARLFRFSDYFGVRVVGIGVALAATAAVVAIAGYDRATTAVVVAFGLTKAVEAVMDVHYGYLQQHERMFPIARSHILRGITSVVVVGSVLWAGGDVALAVLTFGVSSLAVLVLHDRRAAAPLLRASRQPRGPRLHGPTALRIVGISLPLGFVMLFVSLQAYLPRFFVERRFGTSELGLYAALTSLIAAGTLVISALGQSATPRLAQYFHRGEVAAFRSLLVRLVLLGACVGAAGLLVAWTMGEAALRLLFGAEYASRADLLLWVMGVGLLEYTTSFLGYALTSARQFKVQLPLFATTALASAALCSVLVPRYGLVGAVCSWGGALLLQLGASTVIMAHALRARARG